MAGLGLPGNNIIPLITNLQASLKAPSVISSSTAPLENLPNPVTARLADTAADAVKKPQTPNTCDISQEQERIIDVQH